MDLSQRPDVRQKTTLSPQVYQGLAILAMPVQELQGIVDAELLENPTLEIEEPGEGQEDFEIEDVRSQDEEEERAWDEWLDQYEDLEGGERIVPRDPDADTGGSEEFVGGVHTFGDYLLEQLAALDIEPQVLRAARTIIGSLDDDGLLAIDLTEVAELAGVTEADARLALDAVQQLDPAGVGGCDTREALRIQAQRLGVDSPLLLSLIESRLEDVATRRYHRIAVAEGVSEALVREAVEDLRLLNPRPAGAFSSGRAPDYVTPDVTLRRFGDEWVVVSNTESVPVLRISPRYRSMLRSSSGVDKETRRYLKDKVRSAEAFMHNIDRRRDTVSRIAEIILETQSEFFEDGASDLRPMRLEDVAVELGVHLSTVSRGVTGKYMATPYGLFELKHFFSGGYRTSSGLDVAATSVRQHMKKLLDVEDPDKPLSDQGLADELAQQGVPVARRTVAKYREEMGIEPSWARKRR